MNRKYLITALGSAFVGALITIGIMTSQHKEEITFYKSEVTKSNKLLESMCEGNDFGGVRISSVECHGKQEICICGDPNTLKTGM